MNVFTEKIIADLIRKADIYRYKIDARNSRRDIVSKVVSAIYSESIDFRNGAHKATIKGKHCVSIKNHTNVLICRAASLYLTRSFELKAPNRDKVISGVLETLTDSTPMILIKKDIKSFYESIDISSVMKIIFQNALYPMPPLKIKTLLRAFFRDLCNERNGIPRGVGLSAVLSEIVLLEFDSAVKKIDGVYRYFRYVDDMLIFLSDKNALEAVNKRLDELLPENLTYNPAKSIPPIYLGFDSTQSREESFNYLGYNFKFKSESKKEDAPRTVILSIAEEKIKKLKTKIILAIKSFDKDHDEDLLLDRIQFISSNYRISQESIFSLEKKRTINAGIYFNYKLCGEYSGKIFSMPTYKNSHMEELLHLDAFYQICLGKKSKFNYILSRVSPEKKRQLRSISFASGYKKVMMKHFKERRLKEIIKAWKYV